jgi:hypothetical protein
MALLKSISFKGVLLNDAYHRVWRVDCEKTKMSFGLSIHATAADEALTGATYSCAYDLNGANPIAQAYAHLKTLDEFAGALNC